MPSFKKYLLDVYHPDIFLSTWIDSEHDYRELREFLNDYECKLADAECGDLAMRNFHSQLCDPNMVERGTWAPMMQSIVKCNNLKRLYEESLGFRYTHVIRSRIDIQLYGPPKIEEIRKCRSGVLMTSHLWTGDVLSDQFIIGTSETMDRAADAFTKARVALLKFKKEGNIFENKKKFSNEAVMKISLLESNITCQYMKSFWVLHHDK